MDDNIDYRAMLRFGKGSMFLPDWEWISDFDNVKDLIVLKVVNFEKNKEKLDNCPRHRILDLAVTLRIFIQDSPEKAAMYIVNDDMVKAWGIEENDLFDLASMNTSRIWKPLLAPLGSVIRSLEGVPDVYDAGNGENEEEYGVPLYFLSNDMKMNGVIMLFCTDCAQRLSEMYSCDLFILPSSVHELILLPASEDMDSRYLREIVESINREIVEDEDILSDHVYRYIKDESRFIIEALINCLPSDKI